MTEAPEKMLFQPCPAAGWDIPDRVKYNTGHATEYTRTDLADQARAEGFAAGIEAAHDMCAGVIRCRVYFSERARRDDKIFRSAIRAITPPADLAPLLAARDKRVRDEALRDAAIICDQSYGGGAGDVHEAIIALIEKGEE